MLLPAHFHGAGNLKRGLGQRTGRVANGKGQRVTKGAIGLNSLIQRHQRGFFGVYNLPQARGAAGV